MMFSLHFMKWIFKTDFITTDIKINDKNDHLVKRKKHSLQKFNSWTNEHKKAKAEWTSKFRGRHTPLISAKCHR